MAERVCGRAAPDAPERIHDQRRCAGYYHRTSCRGSRGSVSLPSHRKLVLANHERIGYFCAEISNVSHFVHSKSHLNCWHRRSRNFARIIIWSSSAWNLWRGVACGSLGVASIAPPELRDRRSADAASFVVAAPPRCDLRVETRDHAAECSATRVAQAMLTTPANPCIKTFPVALWAFPTESDSLLHRALTKIPKIE